MKVNHLYIVTISYDQQEKALRQEVIEGAKALHARYSKGGGKEGNTRSVHIVEFHPQVLIDYEMESKALVWKDKDYSTITEEKERQAAKEEETVGVYVIGHGSGGSMNVPLEELVAVLRDLAGAGRLHKIAVLVCNVGKGITPLVWSKPYTDVAIEGTAKGPAETTDLYRLCTLLMDKAGNSPMVAGWTCFVTVCNGEMPIAHRPVEVVTGAKETLDEDSIRSALGGEDLGRKSSGGNKKHFSTDSWREERKVIFVASEGTVYRRHPSAWSDKGPSAVAEHQTDNNNVNEKEKAEVD